MTVSEQFMAMEAARAEEAPPPGSYKIGSFVLTPQIQGILIAVLGLGLAGFAAFKMLLPAMEEQTNLKTQIAAKEAEIATQQSKIRQMDEARANLATTQQQKENVLALFAQGATLETLLLDINQIVKQSGGNLESFKPLESSPNEWIFTEGPAQAGGAAAPPPADPAAAPPPTTPSLMLSQAVEGKTMELEMAGTYQQTLDTLRRLERLQQMVVFGEFTSTLGEGSQRIFVDPDGKITEQASANLETNFNLIAVMPLPPEQLKNLAAPPPPPAAAEGEQPPAQ
ncbi:type 4a pilus biogenesis protein PilO [Oscillatoria sp. HE19RPO]|uniref:type 4a pilus biogenesis protein PilO n=1 Tax=Oscillatoria sp. HE19RPO TaxID=2954806 RepID=UPI0020C43CFE|nr:type 4a pilus biogenesis protein PilO [Oscillatoria sp. HE19RPO]